MTPSPPDVKQSAPVVKAQDAPSYRQEALDRQRWRFLGIPAADGRPSGPLLALIVLLAGALAAMLLITTYDTADGHQSLAAYVMKSLLGR